MSQLILKINKSFFKPKLAQINIVTILDLFEA